MYLILKVIVKINKELVQTPYKLFVKQSLVMSVSFFITSLINI